MPLEIFDGKSGPRLIAREPTEPTEIAEVIMDDGSFIMVWHPPGLMKDGYPALSPILASLPPRLLLNITRRQEYLRNDNEAFIERAERVIGGASTLFEQKPGLPFEAGLKLSIQSAIVGLHLATARHVRPFIDKLPILTSVMAGRPLSLRLHKGLYEEAGLHDVPLGTPSAITIYSPVHA